jgi:hypothetical protein
MMRSPEEKEKWFTDTHAMLDRVATKHTTHEVVPFVTLNLGDVKITFPPSQITTIAVYEGMAVLMLDNGNSYTRSSDQPGYQAIVDLQARIAAPPPFSESEAT